MPVCGSFVFTLTLILCGSAVENIRVFGKDIFTTKRNEAKWETLDDGQSVGAWKNSDHYVKYYNCLLSPIQCLTHGTNEEKERKDYTDVTTPGPSGSQKNAGRRDLDRGECVSASLHGSGPGDHRGWSGTHSTGTVPTHHTQSTRTRKKSAVMSDWRRKLNACRHPSTESVADIPSDTQLSSCVCTSFRRSSSDSSAINNAESSPVAPDSPILFTLAVPHSFAYCPPEDTVYDRDNMRPVRCTRNSAFCPCFSPTDSDDEEETTTTTVSNQTQVRVPALTSASRQIIAIARDIRSRLVVAADANAQANGPLHIRRQMGDGILLASEPYPVHTTVEYRHYLVPDLLKITMAPYYWGVMDRFEAEKQLDGKPEGTFLLRDSAQSDYLFSVSFRRYQRTLHARIEQSEHRFSFDSYDPGVFSAPTVTELIENYKDPARCLFFEPQLSHPLNRPFVFPLQHMCRAVICAGLSYDNIKNVPVPRQFMDYLRQYHYKQPIRVTNLETNQP